MPLLEPGTTRFALADRSRTATRRNENRGKHVSDALNATVMQIVEVSPGLAIFRVVPDEWTFDDFQAGQFGVLGLPGNADRCAVCDSEDEPADPEKIIKRAYSIASSSVTREFIEFYIVLVPSGRLTPRLFALKPGERVWLGPKIRGMFTLEDTPEDRHVVLVSTGTGLAPYMSMLRSQLTCGSRRRFAVLHGARHSWDLGYRSELMTLARMCPNFTYIPTISRPDEEPVPWAGESGYIQDLWQRDPLKEGWGFSPTPEGTHVFLCGNPSMVETMVEVLGESGFREHKRREPGQIHVERYW